MIDNQYLLDKCKKLIEEKIGWGSSESWHSQDFENLSEQIFEATEVALSASTLKRIWGKVQYNSKPNSATLDALAQFAGFENWRSFTCSKLSPDPIPQTVPLKKPYVGVKVFSIILLSIVCIVVAGFMFIHKPVKTLSYNNIYFSSKAVTSGVPNTVIFNYNADETNADSVFIQQSWDASRRHKVEKQKHEYASTYYLPGYYRAKLVLNDSIVKEHDVYIESNGWMGLVNTDPVPIYLGEKIFKHNNWLEITEDDLKNERIDYNKGIPRCILTNVSKSYNVSSENFALKLDLQNTYTRSNAPCKQVNIVLLGTDGIILIPLSAPGCVGELRLILGDKSVDGTTNDLSAFGVNSGHLVQLACISSLHKIKINLNGKTAYEGTFGKGIGKIAGVRVIFMGTGYIKSFELKSAS